MANETTPRIVIKLRVACPEELELELQSIQQLSIEPQSSRRVIRHEGIPVWQCTVFEGNLWDLDQALQLALDRSEISQGDLIEFCNQNGLSRWLSADCDYAASAPSVVLTSELLQALVDRGLWLDVHLPSR